MRRRFAPLLALFLLLSGCDIGPVEPSSRVILPGADEPASPSPSPSPGIVLPQGPAKSRTFGLAWTPAAAYDPLTEALRYNDDWSRLCYEGLFELGPDWEPVPALCSSWTAQDNKVFTLSLRAGVTFHDGAPLTPQDVVYSFQQAMRPESPYAGRFAGVVSVAASEENPEDVVVTLSAPAARFTALLDFPIVPAAAPRDGVLPGTGPYIPHLDGGDAYLLASPNWWRGKRVSVSRIELVEAGSPDELAYGFQNGAVALTPLDPFDPVAPGLHAAMETWEVPTANMVFFGFNTALPPLDDAGVRRALSAALNREELVTGVYATLGRPTPLPAPPESEIGRLASSWPEYDMRAAALALGALGFADEDSDGVLERKDNRGGALPLAFDLIVNEESPARAALAQSYSQALRALGVRASVVALPYDEYAAALAEGAYGMVVGETRLPGDFSLANFLDSDGLWNAGAFADEELSARRGELAAAPSAQAAYATWRVFDRLAETAPFVVVCFRSTLLCAQRGLVSGPTPLGSNLFYGWPDWTMAP